MPDFLALVQSPAFISFLSTFGLAVVLVLYFVIYRDPKQARFWQKKYDDLSESYSQLSENYNTVTDHLDSFWKDQTTSLNQNFEGLKEAYQRLESDLDPKSRVMSEEQARSLCHVGLDRDLYKLYYYVQRRVMGKENTEIALILHDTIIDTNKTWSSFTSPFPLVPRISDLFSVYTNAGGQLSEGLEATLREEGTEEEKVEKAWNTLLNNTINMKREFDDNLEKLRSQRLDVVRPYGSSEAEGGPSGSEGGSSEEEEDPEE